MNSKNLLLIFLIIIYSIIGGTRCFAQKGVAGKVVTKVVKNVVKKNSDDAVKLAGKSSHAIYRKEFTKNLKKTLKKNGVKSCVQLACKKSALIIGNPAELRTTKSVIDRNFKSWYSNAIKKHGNVRSMVLQKKIVLKIAGKEYDLPSGKEAIRVVWDPKRKCPRRLYNPMKENGNNIGKEYNRILLKEQRKAISPYHQFPTIEQLKNYDESALIIGKQPSGAILRENLYRTMDKNAYHISWGFGGNAAHHIIEGKDAAASASRKLLEKFKIDINAPENGILLPTSNSSIYKGAVHKTGHSPKYSKYVYSKLKGAKDRNECIRILTEIKHELYEGKLTLEGPLQQINRNINKL